MAEIAQAAFDAAWQKFRFRTRDSAGRYQAGRDDVLEQAAIQDAIEAALPHLTTAEGPRAKFPSGFIWSRPGGETVSIAPDEVTIVWGAGGSNAPSLIERERIREEAFNRGVLIGRDEASSESEVFALLAAGIPIPDGESTERERNAERRHREEIARALARPTLVADVEFETTGPTDYEVWRDALQMALTWVGDGTGKHDLIEEAQWFQARLRQALMEPDEFRVDD